MRDMRKHTAWYLHDSGRRRHPPGVSGEDLDELDALLRQLDADVLFLRTPPVRAAGRARVVGINCPKAGSTIRTTSPSPKGPM